MSTYRIFRLSFLAAALLLVGGGRLAAADSYPFEIRLSNSVFGEKVFTGQITPEDGSFELFTTSGSTRIHMTGSIEGNHVHVYGELIIPGAASWQRFKPFSADADFGSDGKARDGIVAYPSSGTAARGSITITRPATAIAAAPTAPAIAQPTQPTTPPTTATTQPTTPTATQTAVVPPPEPEEPALTTSERVTVQHQLNLLGFYRSNADGDFGPGTRKAIKSFQRANKLDATGYLTGATLALLAEKASLREQQLADEQAAAQQQAVAQQATAQQALQQNANADFTARDQSASKLPVRTPEELAQTPSQPSASTTTPETTAATTTQPTVSATTEPATTQPTTSTTVATAEPQQPAAQPPQAPAQDFNAVIASLEPIDESYVAVKPAKVRTQPAVTADLVETLNVGDHIDVLGRLPREDWYLVARNGKPVGYVVISQLAAQSTAAAAGTASAQTPTAPQQQAQASAQAPAASAAPAIPPELAALDYGRDYALVIGDNNYKKLPKLNTAVDDAKAVAATLEQDYGFTVSVLTDATREQVVGALGELRRSLTPKDNLLIYYAGHGWYDDGADRGYWLPVDAVAENQSQWISSADITDVLRAMQAKHVLVVADSCYSGSLNRGLAIGSGSSSYIQDIVGRRARTVLTSGGKEPVLDAGGGNHSVFAKAFLDALNANHGVIDGESIFHQVHDQVRLNAEQEPEYGNIRLAGHDGGDFLFVRKH